MLKKLIFISALFSLNAFANEDNVNIYPIKEATIIKNSLNNYTYTFQVENSKGDILYNFQGITQEEKNFLLESKESINIPTLCQTIINSKDKIEQCKNIDVKYGISAKFNFKQISLKKYEIHSFIQYSDSPKYVSNSTPNQIVYNYVHSFETSLDQETAFAQEQIGNSNLIFKFKLKSLD